MYQEWNPARLATAATFYNLHEADIAVGLLESCGVVCFLCDEQMHRVHPLASDVIGGVRLQVAHQDLELAKELLKEYVPLQEPPGPIE
jgi:Putative prokaryotic signal transducing protein